MPVRPWPAIRFNVQKFECAFRPVPARATPDRDSHRATSGSMWPITEPAYTAAEKLRSRWCPPARSLARHRACGVVRDMRCHHVLHPERRIGFRITERAIDTYNNIRKCRYNRHGSYRGQWSVCRPGRLALHDPSMRIKIVGELPCGSLPIASVMPWRLRLMIASPSISRSRNTNSLHHSDEVLPNLVQAIDT